MVADDDDDDDMLERKSKTTSFINSDKFSKAEQLQSMQESGEALDKKIQSMQQTLRKTKNVSFDPQTASPLDDNVAPALRKKIEELQNARAKLTALQNGIKSAKQLSRNDSDQNKPKDSFDDDGKEKQGSMSTTLTTPPPKNSDHDNTTDEKSIIDIDDEKSEIAEKKTFITPPPSSSSEVDIPVKKKQDNASSKRKPAIIIPPPPPSNNDVDRSSNQKSVLITPPPSSSDSVKDSDDNQKSEKKAVTITPPPSVSKNISKEMINSSADNSENQSVSALTNSSNENDEDDLSQIKKPIIITSPPSSSISEEIDNVKEIQEKKTTLISPTPSSQTSESDEKAVDDDIEKKESVIIPPPPSSINSDKPKSSISEGPKDAKTVEFSSEKVGGVPKAIIVPPQSIDEKSGDEVKSGIDDDDKMDKVDIGTEGSTDLTAELDGFKDFASVAKKEDDVEKSGNSPSREIGKKSTSSVKEIKPRAPDDQNYTMSLSSTDSNSAKTESRDGKTVYAPVKDGNPSFDIPSRKTSKISAHSPDKEVSTDTFSSKSFNPQQGSTVKSRPTSEQISYLLKQQQDRETQVNRLKLQLNEFRAALSQTEEQKQNMETNLRKWKLVKKNLEDREKSDSVQEKLMQEKEDLQIEIKNLNDQIMKLGMSSESKFEELKQQSDGEINSLKEKIKELQKELHATSSELKSKEEELKNVTAINDKDEETSLFQGKKRDIEMEKITKERNQYSQQVQDLQTKFSKVEDELFDTINKLKRVEKELTMFQLDSQHDKQNDDVTSENEEKTVMLIEKYKTELEELKRSKEKELEQVLVKAESEKASLRAALAKRQKEIDTLKSEVQYLQSKADASGTEKSVDSTIAMMKKSTEEEKKELEKKILDLQAKAQNAEVKLKSSTEEVDKLKNIVGSFQKQIEEMEKLSNQQSAKADEKDNHETLYYQSRLKNIILKAQKLMVRRRKRAESKLSEMKHNLEKEFEAQQEAFKTEQEMLLKKKDTELSELRLESDSEISNLTNELKEANMRAQSELEKMKEQYEDEVRNIRMTALQEKDDAIGKVEEKYKVILETEIQKVGEEKKRLAEEHKSALTRIQVKSEKEREILNAEWNETYMRSVREKKALREMVQEKNEIIEEYESERDSFRKMASRTIQNAGDRFTKRRKRNIFLKGNENEEKE